MRTNIELNEQLVAEAQRYSEARTKRALVEEALRTYVEVKAEKLRRETYRDRVTDLQQRTAGLRLRTSPSDVLREDRSR
jgi:Arc/MetJ family transcription regulator